MVAEAVVGIDVGTTAVKAAVISSQGRVQASYSASYPMVRQADSRVEQNPDDWLAIIQRALREFANHESAATISSIGLCSQVNTHVFVNAAGEPLLPAISWQDGRARAEALELDQQVTEEQKIRWWGTPMPIDASHLLPRMLWLSRHHPQLWQRVATVALPKDYCIFKLTGEWVSDALSNIGLTNGEQEYVAELFDILPGALQKMPLLQPITAEVGTVKAALPLAGKPVINCTMDAWTGLIGSGGATAGSAVYLSGTSEILGISSPNLVPTPGAIVFPKCEGIRLHAAPTQNGGDAKKWFAEGFELPLDQMSQLVASAERQTATPLFLPQLDGERAPLWDASLRGAFLGVSRRTGQRDFARAVYEGVAFSARWILETLEKSSGVSCQTIYCGGNGFKSDPWAQIRADILGVPLQRLAVAESGILGAAMLAMIGSRICSDFESAAAMLRRVERTFEPNLALHERYSELFALYKRAVIEIAELNSRIAKVSSEIG